MRPDYTDEKSGAMAWDLADRLVLWLRNGEWRICTSFSEPIPAARGEAMAAACEAAREKPAEAAKK